MSMCNNDVTYADKWDTMENNAAKKQLVDKFFDRSVCSPSCPVSWAPEVLILLNRLDKEFGIARNTQTIYARRVDNKYIRDSIIGAFNNARYELYREIKKRDGKELTKKQRVLNSIAAAKDSLGRAYKAFSVLYINPILNKILRPKIHLAQVKEKYGYLTLYLNYDPQYKEYIDGLIHETVVKLATKGAYYPLETVLKKAKDE